MADRNKKQPKLRQVAALAYRVEADRSLRILVLTSLDTRRTIIPKGWSMKGIKDHAAAAREAFEEAGVVGKVSGKAVGKYHYWKRRKDFFSFVRVDVYPLKVQTLVEDYPEAGLRQHAWLTPDEAALLIDEPKLSTLVRRFGDRVRRSSADKAPRAAEVPA